MPARIQMGLLHARIIFLEDSKILGPRRCWAPHQAPCLSGVESQEDGKPGARTAETSESYDLLACYPP